ncbi:MAG: preprotein translocase subunit YajC, partial [Epsilonproteobacteria bacterium]|nr:preprotein translocase subunit YajC [Campylobacterota bacterium]
HQEMINSLKKGDKILTNGGLVAEVVKVEDDFIKIKLNDEVVVKLAKSYVAKKLD